MADVNVAYRNLVGAVFGAPNTYRTRNCASVEDVPVFDQAVDDSTRQFEKGKWQQPIIFPRRGEEEDKITWYACAQDDTEFRSLVSEMAAFVGPTYSNFDGEIPGLSD